MPLRPRRRRPDGRPTGARRPEPTAGGATRSLRRPAQLRSREAGGKGPDARQLAVGAGPRTRGRVAVHVTGDALEGDRRTDGVAVRRFTGRGHRDLAEDRHAVKRELPDDQAREPSDATACQRG
jgi:hypothetical protein